MLLAQISAHRGPKFDKIEFSPYRSSRSLIMPIASVKSSSVVPPMRSRSSGSSPFFCGDASLSASRLEYESSYESAVLLFSASPFRRLNSNSMSSRWTICLTMLRIRMLFQSWSRIGLTGNVTNNEQ